MSVYSWAQRHREEGQWGLMTRKEREEQLRTPTKAALEKSLPDDPAELKKQLAQLLVDKAILEKELDLVKKDVSVIPGQLTNKQKTDVVDALRRTWPLPLLLASIGLPGPDPRLVDTQSLPSRAGGKVIYHHVSETL